MKQTPKLSATILLLICFLFIPFTQYGPQMEIYALDVGQGDSTLIVTPERHRILIDGGRDSSVIGAIDQIIPFWDRHIDIIILTHPDADHITGLIDVLKRYQVGKVLITPFKSESEVYKVFMQVINRKETAVEEFFHGRILETNDGVSIQALWPEKNNMDSLNSNSSSQVGLLKYEEFTGLLTGDIDTDTADKISSRFRDIDYLKVPHHGSKFNLTLKHLYTLSPEISTISVGANNSYGHPNKDTISNLYQAKSVVYRTDIDGTIRVLVNSSGINVSSE